MLLGVAAFFKKDKPQNIFLVQAVLVLFLLPKSKRSNSTLQTAYLQCMFLHYVRLHDG